jgi:NAD(P)-dependent dehydrogenase (short-subunit alcohol dehydrogenase family)
VVCSDIQPTARPVDTADKPDPETHVQIQQSYGAKNAIYQPADVSSSASVQSLVEQAVSEYGRVDIMVNNAGIAPKGGHSVWDESEESWDQVMNVNGKGVFLGCKFAAGQMLKQEPGPSGDRGWIVNISSILGLGGQAGTCKSLAENIYKAGVSTNFAGK